MDLVKQTQNRKVTRGEGQESGAITNCGWNGLWETMAKPKRRGQISRHTKATRLSHEETQCLDRPTARQETGRIIFKNLQQKPWAQGCCFWEIYKIFKEITSILLNLSQNTDEKTFYLNLGDRYYFNSTARQRCKKQEKKSTGQYLPVKGVSKILNKIISKPFQYVERPMHVS